MPDRIPGKKIRLAIARYIHYVLLISGMAIFFFLILDHFLHNGMTLSHSEKTLYIVLAACASLLILAGFWTGTALGRERVTRLLRHPENEIVKANQNGHARFFGWLILMTAYAIVFVTYLDFKYSVVHLDAARNFNDTSGYVNLASYSLTDIRFWTGRRPFTVPLFYKISGYTLSNYDQQEAMERVSRNQSFFSIFSWWLLAISFSLAMKHNASKIFAFAIILFLGTGLNITQWDRSMLAESISTSFMVLLLALLVMAGLLWDKRQQISGWMEALLLTIILFLAIFFAFSRETNAYLLLAFSGLMFIGLFLPSTRTHPLFRAYLVIVVGFFVIFSLLNLTMNRSRYVNSVFSVIVYRMIPNHESLNYLIAHGMPYDESYISLASVNLKQLTTDAMSEESVKHLYAWVGDHGIRVVTSFLLSHPLYTLSAPFKDVQSWVNSENNGYRKALIPTLSRIHLLSTIMYIQWDWSPVVFLVLFFVCVGMIWYGRQRGSLWFFVFSLFISAYPMALLIWHSDPGELERHAFQVALQLRLASWMLIAFMFERGLILLQERIKTGRQLK
jgi:hypothetical protein